MLSAVADSNSVKGRVRVDLQAKYRCHETFAPEQKTTLMLRGIPRCCTQEAFISNLEAVAGGRVFDFIYLPWDSKRSGNMGFAFVNCSDPGVAHNVLRRIQSQPISFVRDVPREIHALFGHVQGLTLNVAHYIGSSVVSEGQEHAPVIFHGGRRISFQEAVDRFVPPELAEAQLREAEWAKSAAVLDVAQVKVPVLSAPKSAPPALRPNPMGPRKGLFLSPASGPSAQATSPTSTRGPQAMSPNQSWSGASLATPGVPLLRPFDQGPSKTEILRSQTYATAWALLNSQLEILSAVASTSS